MPSDSPHLRVDERHLEERIELAARDRGYDPGALGASTSERGASTSEHGASTSEPRRVLAVRLREQATGALAELLRGVQSDARAVGEVLGDGRPERRREIRSGLVAALMGLVCLLVAESRDLLAAEGSAPTRQLEQLFAQLEADRRRLGDGLDGRHEAWPLLLQLLEAVRASDEPPLSGRFSDGVVHRVLSRLMVLDGARVRYEELEIERIGSIYEALMEYDVQIAAGDSMALLPAHRVVDLEALLSLPGEARVAALRETAELSLGARLSAAVRDAQTVDALEQALARRASPHSEKRIPRGALFLEPGLVRRRAGSYYTPREITRLVVERTLAPLLDAGGGEPSPEEVLSLRVCDPAMGSGAFLMEACRQLASHLEDAWRRAGATPEHARGEEVSHAARRLVAERCLYGVDLDPLAVQLSRLSLWLVARGKERPSAFLGGRLRCGNSLVGAKHSDLMRFPAESTRRAGRRGGAKGDRTGPDERGRADEREAVGRNEDGAIAPGAAEASLDAWMALWFWKAEGGSGVEAPTAATFADYLRAARDPGEPRAAVARRIAGERRFFHWESAFAEVFEGPTPGFHAIVGNPPWVAYVGRAAQPIEPEAFNFFVRRNPAFHGYRTMHGLFIYQAATLLRIGGRLGLVVPTSVSDLSGYEPTRRAHDAMCAVDPDLPSFGSDAFEGVFQPAMALLSTRVAVEARERVGVEARERVGVDAPPSASREARGAPWRLLRSDLDWVASGLLSRLCALPPLAAALFGERGYQTSAEDAEHIRRAGGPATGETCPIREGSDIGEFLARAPRHVIDPAALKGRFRPEGEWRSIKVLIRQTARYPIAALGDGVPFRNSILAGFADEVWSEFALLCYLNSWPIRWYHYARHRDAREGMPQVKIAHLRALPEPVDRGLIGELDAIGRELGTANAGVSVAGRGALEDVVARMLALTEAERACVARWAEVNPVPRWEG